MSGMLEDRAESRRQEDTGRSPRSSEEAGTLLTGSVSMSYSACFRVQPGPPARG